MVFIDDQILEVFLRQQGASITGRAVTETLCVSPEGTGADGKSWERAYQTIQDALDAASVDPDDCTLILISPHTTFYDIDTVGDPTWSCNVILRGTHRGWQPIRNNAVGATSVMNFTGKASLENMAIFHTGTQNGISFTSSGYRIRHCGFNSEGLTGVGTSIIIDGTATTVRGGLMDEVEFRGHVTHTTALQINTAYVNHHNHLHIHNCLVGIHILGAGCNYNYFFNSDIGDNATGVLIAAGDEQHFERVYFHHNTVNVTDAVGNSTWVDIHGAFPVAIEPADLVGTPVPTDAAAHAWGVDTPLRAAVASTKPFRIVGG